MKNVWFVHKPRIHITYLFTYLFTSLHTYTHRLLIIVFFRIGLGRRRRRRVRSGIRINQSEQVLLVIFKCASSIRRNNGRDSRIDCRRRSVSHNSVCQICKDAALKMLSRILDFDVLTPHPVADMALILTLILILTLLYPVARHHSANPSQATVYALGPRDIAQRLIQYPEIPPQESSHVALLLLTNDRAVEYGAVLGVRCGEALHLSSCQR